MMKSPSILLAAAALSATLGSVANAQTVTVRNGQKVLLDKHGQVMAPPPVTSLPSAPLVGGSDSCMTPDVITGTGLFAWDITVATTGAEGQNEALCLYATQLGINYDVWFTWTAPFTGNAVLYTCGLTTMDSKVAVYAGVGCPTGAALACNDDSCGLQTRINWPVTSGTSYTIQFGKYGTAVGTSGNFGIIQDIPPTIPPNDDCATPIVLPGPGQYPFDNRLATQGVEGQTTTACGPNTFFYKDVWFTYTPASGGTATISTCGLIGPFSSSNDTKIEVFDGAGCPVAPAVMCADDTGCGPQALATTLTWTTVCGQTYTIQLGQYAAVADIQGMFDLSESGTPCGPTGQPYCFGDGTGAACPCANNGAAGNGCASSVSPNGANLSTTGVASIANDTLVLNGTGMPNSSCLYFQGTTQIGTAFGDGLRCAGGVVTRLATKTNVGGASQYPAAGDASVHVKGNVSVPGTRTYQVWYRNAAAYCTASTFNLTNGVLVAWQ
jgi:hypothetical protein